MRANLFQLAIIIGSLFTVVAHGLKDQNLYLGGFFPLEDLSGNNWQTGNGILAACRLAVDLINNSTNILPNHRLVLIANDTKVRRGLLPRAQRVLFNYIFRPPTKLALIGAGYSSVTEPLAATSALWNLLLVSYSASSPVLSNRQKFPYFFRTIESEISFNNPRIELLKYYNWNQIALLYESENIFSETMDDFRSKIAVNNNITIISSESFADQPKEQVKQIKEKDARIIIASFYEDTGRKVICEAYHHGLFGAKYVWILIGWLEVNWWDVAVTVSSGQCTREQMREVITGQIAIDLTYVRKDDKRAISGQTASEFTQAYSELVPNVNKRDLYAAFAYDAVYAIALALNQSEVDLVKYNKTLSDFTYNDLQMARIFRTNMQNLLFEGISGTVSFTAKGTRIDITGVTQKVNIGIYDGQAKQIAINNDLVQWKSNRTPIASVRYSFTPLHIDLALLISMYILATCGILLAIAFLTFNIILRHERFIKMSSPRINNLIVVGCSMMYFAIYVFGLDGRWVSQRNFHAVCVARGWFPVIGFTFMFGSIFAKTYRVHKIFTSGKANKVVRAVMKDTYLFGLIGILLLMDITILTAWQIIDPMYLKILNLTAESSPNQDVVRLPQIWLCDSNNKVTWLIALFVLKGTVVMVAVFFAWETRKVTVAALNDSQYIGMAVYNVVILGIVGVPVIIILADQINPTFALTSGFIVFGNTVVLCLVFVPKVSNCILNMTCIL
ncbi:uncharacterized protein TRIADDRAFT_26726 [Trichoplax adhaerens]|uniref:G-protein coupled receptors family 3 profile domain-containing protein n=1 Tax=Trichoplax adhaerens TaxID=10228 RepID=B3S0W4_TRIAD|nr:hypothetical protein TRIADDRAFT_26726 [Trichoplax adhaerens]EDV23717.1 hypothetical protein TRIADDRAFT_26726 [Trichoplax adhaerens]|eukprot:XP_002113243.1 hypothetical protein TRIADDRAFT_26726 [Trichoplax adhaerens]